MNKRELEAPLVRASSEAEGLRERCQKFLDSRYRWHVSILQVDDLESFVKGELARVPQAAPAPKEGNDGK